MTQSGARRRLESVRRHGYNGLALLTLYQGWQYFEDPDIDGFVAYELHGRVAVACGDPVCTEEDLVPLMTQFASHCRERQWRFIFVGASARAGAVGARLGFRALKIGEEPFLDVAPARLSGTAAKKARAAINRARRTGVLVEEYAPGSPERDAEIEALSQAWVSSRPGPPLSFLLRSRPLEQADQKRIFMARHQDRIVGFITCSPARARSLLYIEELARHPHAPYGASELLIETARQAARDTGYERLSLGTAPLLGATTQPLGRFRFLKGLFALAYGRINFVYSFRSLNHFKKKFAAPVWEDNFVVFDGGLLTTAVATLRAFAPDGIASLVIPKRFISRRLDPQLLLAASATVLATATATACWFLVRHWPQSLEFSRVVTPLALGQDLAGLTLLAHPFASAAVLAGGGALLLSRRSSNA